MSCPQGSTAAISPDGRDGCCVTGGSLELNSFSCVQDPDSDADVFVRLDQASQTCQDYTLSVHY